jgi:hypothetical protein
VRGRAIRHPQFFMTAEPPSGEQQGGGHDSGNKSYYAQMLHIPELPQKVTIRFQELNLVMFECVVVLHVVVCYQMQPVGCSIQSSTGHTCRLRRVLVPRGQDKFWILVGRMLFQSRLSTGMA